MSLRPIDSPAMGREFSTYDLEWWPETLELRLVGVYDKRHGYRSYTSIRDFLDGELTHANRGRTFFAHAGGSYDVQFLLSEILEKRPHVSVEAAFSGSSAVVVKVKDQRHVWTFADSFFLMKDKLARIATWVGSEAKGTKEEMLSPDMRVLREYNEKDCRILYKAIERVQDGLLGLGGELRNTIASCAMALFRRRYLGREIKTSDAGNNSARLAYVASRVEVHGGRCGRANYYDYNSSFPFSMTKPQPANLRKIGRVIPDSGLWLAEVELRVPEVYLPPLPYRQEGEERVFFPWGKWTGWIDCADAEALYEAGGRIEKVMRVHVYDEFTDLAAYVHDLYERKAKATDAFERILYKYLLNSLYGKFAERGDKRKILINPERTTCLHVPAHANDGCMRILMPGVWEMAETVDVPHAHVPISVHVTALSRGMLWRDAVGCKRLYYCDTDSIVCVDEKPTGEELGALKLEKRLVEGTFVEPKLYAVTDEAGKTVVRSKGFRQLSVEDFRKLVEGEDLVIQRMARIRENLGAGTLKVRDLKVKKGLRRAVIPKRCDTADGNTRPWHVGELCSQ